MRISHLQLRPSSFIFVLGLALLLVRLEGAAPHPIAGRHGMVVTSHALSSEVGVEILRRGGNAIDAAIAVGYSLAVTHPTAGNIGGGGFMVVRLADGRSMAFDFRERAPAAAHERMYLNSEGVYKEPTNHEGYLAVGVPGTVAGFFLAHEELGKLPMSQLLRPAIRQADKGFALSWSMARSFKNLGPRLKKYPGSAKKFLKPDKSPYEPGEIWRQPDLARTLRRIQKKGRDGFYRGETARLLAQDMKRNGGLISEQDLAGYQALKREPVRGTYRGFEIISMPPPSSGGVALIEMLNILEGFEVAEYGHSSALHLHVMAESMRHAFADRAQFLGDPDFNPNIPIQRLLSKDYAAGLRKRISLNRAGMSDSVYFNTLPEPEETTHYSVIDSAGNSVVVTYTLEQGYGSKIVAPGTGFLLNNEMGDFNPEPGLTNDKGLIGTPPNIVAPGKRMLSSMTPTLVAKDGRPLLLIGSPGGRTIINTVLQVILNVVDFEMDIGEAIGAPRIHHQWFPDVLNLEKFGTSSDTIRLLEMFGHEVKIANFSRRQGSAMGIWVDQENGIYYGSADPRASDGAARGY